jgi:hypothetical protein
MLRKFLSFFIFFFKFLVEKYEILITPFKHLKKTKKKTKAKESKKSMIWWFYLLITLNGEVGLSRFGSFVGGSTTTCHHRYPPQNSLR